MGISGSTYRHRFGWHDRVVFRCREVGESESMPKNDICIVETAIGIGLYPGWNTL